MFRFDPILSLAGFCLNFLVDKRQPIWLGLQQNLSMVGLFDLTNHSIARFWMKWSTRFYWIGVLLLGVALCGCKSVPSDSRNPAVEKPTAAAPQPVAGDSALWKIPPRPGDEIKPLAPLEDITKLFRATYAAARTEVQASQGTVILTRLSGATLFRSGQIVETVRVIPAEYHNLRYASHVPLMIFLKLYPHRGLLLDAATRSDLEKYVEVIKRAELALAYTKLSAPQLVRQHRILDNALAFLQQTFDAGKVEDEQLRRYVRAASLDVEQNMREAGAAQVDGLHQQMLKWRQQIPDPEWRRIHFIVHGPQQPRGGSAMTLYFSALLKDPEEMDAGTGAKALELCIERTLRSRQIHSLQAHGKPIWSSLLPKIWIRSPVRHFSPTPTDWPSTSYRMARGPGFGNRISHCFSSV